jgi:DnaK suppressor protein
MAQEKADVLRAAFEAWNSGDMDAVRALYDPEVVMHPPEGWPEPGPFVGRDAVMRQWQQQREAWDVDAVESIGGYIEAGDRVAVRQIWHRAGQGPEAGLEMTNVVTVRGGVAVEQAFFWDHAQALEALGLHEREDDTDVEALLRGRLAELQARIAELAKAPEPGAGIGFGKRIGDGTSEAISRRNDIGVGNSLLVTEEKLERALAKLDEGSYGRCDSCGGPIAPGRLEVAPESALCIDCAR